MSSYEETNEVKDIKEEDVIYWIKNREKNLILENKKLNRRLEDAESWQEKCMDREELIFKNITTLIENSKMGK